MISQAELKEMKQFGEIGTCKVCGKKALKYIFMEKNEGMTKEQLKKYGAPYKMVSGTHVLVDGRCGECRYKNELA
jgi:hypothetical protein